MANRYNYECDHCGTDVDRFCEAGQQPKYVKCPVCGKRAYRNFTVMTAGTTSWPLKSDSMGVHPAQVNQAEAQARKLGVPTDFDRKTGQAVFRDKTHRRNYCRAKGVVDYDGGYGDP